MTRLSEMGVGAFIGPTGWPSYGPPETTKAVEDLFDIILVCARSLGVDLARELELKMEKNRGRFPVGSRPDVGY